MAVTNVFLLRKAGGQHSASTETYDLTFRVETDGSTDGPDTVLSVFPVGAPLGYYKSRPTQSLSETRAPNFYAFPWPLGKCNGSAFADYNYRLDAILTSATIISRESGDTAQDVWLVNCTFQLDKFVGPNSPVTITPYYRYEDEPQKYAYWWGYRQRVGNSNTGECSTQPGEWGKPFVGGDGELGGKLTKEEHLSTKEYRKPIIPVNSAGVPFTEILTQRVGKPAFRVSWFSYTALDFSCAIGRVNKNEYRLRSYNRGPRSNYQNYPNADPDLVFCKKFCPRELLISDVSCDIVSWGGRNNYRYTVDLLYDPDNKHFSYRVDSGFSQLAEIGDLTNQGSKYGSDDVDVGSRLDSQSTLGNDGLVTQNEILLNGRGKKLEGQDPGKVFYHKYDVYEEIDFPDWKQITPDNQRHNWDKNAKFPLMMDGGVRYSEADKIAPWNCDLTTIECTDPYKD